MNTSTSYSSKRPTKIACGREQKQTPFKFFWEVIKPYKWWYLLMMQAPFSCGIHSILYNYSIKLLIDLFSNGPQITTSEAVWPVSIFIFASIFIEACWRIHNFAAWKSMPYIMRSVMQKVNNYLMGHSYAYFQNSLSGSIVSKVKGINDGVQKIHNALEFQVSVPVILTISAGIALGLVNLKLFFVVALFSAILGSVSFYFGKKLTRIEQEKENAWHAIIGSIADNVSNIFTVFSYGKTFYEKQKIVNEYNLQYLPRALKWHKVDFLMSCIAATIYCCFVAVIVIYLIHLRNTGQITVGDIAYVLLMTYVFLDNAWRAINHIKDFAKDIASFKASLQIMQTPQEKTDKPDATELVL